MSPSPSSVSTILCGMPANSVVSLAAASGVSVPVRRPRWIATSASAASCAVKHLVDATPISGPACVYSEPCDERGIAESTTLQMARTRQPRARASFTAASVSAVSPLCEMAMTRSPGPTTGSR